MFFSKSVRLSTPPTKQFLLCTAGVFPTLETPVTLQKPPLLFPPHIFSCHTVSPSSSAICSSELLNLYCSKSTFHLFFTYSHLTLAIHLQFFEEVYLAVVVQAVRGLVFLSFFSPRSSWNLVRRKSHSHSCFPVRVYEEPVYPQAGKAGVDFLCPPTRQPCYKRISFPCF